MSVSFISARCPECGASLSIEEGREKAFCTYCGTPIVIADDNERRVTHLYHYVDDAEIKKEENRRREIELGQQAVEYARANKSPKIIASTILGIIGALFTILGYAQDSKFGIGLMVVGLMCVTAITMIWGNKEG